MNSRPTTTMMAVLLLFSPLVVVEYSSASVSSPFCGDRYTETGNYWKYDAESAYAFGLKIQDAVQKRDLVALFSLVNGELTSGPRRRYAEKRSFDEVFPESWRLEILNSEPDCTPVGWRGFMLAGGRIWYRSNPFRIVAINEGTEEEFPPVPTGWEVDGKILSPECFAREWPSSDNFKIFGEFASQFGIRIGKYGTPNFVDFRNNPGKFPDEVFYPFDPIFSMKQ